MASEDWYVFIVEWYDQQACLIRQYNLTYFLADNTIEMVNLCLIYSLTSRIEESS